MIDDKVVKKVARLSRLHLNESDIQKTASDLNRIVEWIDQLSAIDTKGIEPLANVMARTPHLRDDIAQETPGSNLVTQNAPERDCGMFLVPKVVE